MNGYAPLLYSFFRQPKKNGGFRDIRPPKKNLRVFQRVLYQELGKRVRYPRWMMGGVPRRSIFMHARPHVGRHMVGTLDIERFFPSINPSHVRSVFERFNISGDALDALVRLTTIHDQLPQGSPASCFLANLMFDPIDRQIDALCRKHKLSYTRYIDDMAISGNVDLRPFQGAIINSISQFKLTISPDKIFWMERCRPQVITCICVNNKLRPLKAFIENVEESIWECRKGGGPTRLALELGLSLRRLRSRITGRVRHIGRSDPVLGRKLKGKLCDIEWGDKSSQPTLGGPGIRRPIEKLADPGSEITRPLPDPTTDEYPTVTPPW